MFLQQKETSRNKTNPASSRPCKKIHQKQKNKKQNKISKDFCLRLIGSQFFIHCQDIFGQFRLKLASIESRPFFS